MASRVYSSFLVVGLAHRCLHTDVDEVAVSPKWPPVPSVLKPEHATYEVASVNLSSISFITNRVMKVRHFTVLDLCGILRASSAGRCFRDC